MKNILLLIFLVFNLLVLSSTGFAEEKPSGQEEPSWDSVFAAALQKGKTPIQPAEGLAYTPSEDTVLETAIQAAMEMKAPPCEAMKIAVDLKYNPYSVIKNIFGYGSQVNLNQLCMCATESGINKQIVASAAADAATPLGTPVFSRDEITQAQCIGLGYTPVAATPSRVNDETPDPVSASAPST